MPADQPPVTSTERKPLSMPQKALRKMGLLRPVDMALHLPMRYEDETRLGKLSSARDGDNLQFEAVVQSCQVVFKPRRQLQAVVTDGSDICTLRFFNFYPNMQKALEVGRQVRLRGELRGGFMGYTMMHPTVQAAGAPLASALTPVYPSTAELPQAYLRKAVLGGLARALQSDAFTETIPQNHLPPHAWGLRESLQFLHHPSPDVSLGELEDRSHPAWQRLKAEELLAQQLSQLQAKRERQLLNAPVLAHSIQTDGVLAQLQAVLPFKLTGAQQRVVTEIANDVARAVPMHRLLQGDVGSGKTVVAALAAAQCIDAGWQCALMAPTEILAEQHFAKLVGWLAPVLQPLGLQVAWLTGSQKKKERDAMLSLVASGEAALVVGTHAVIQDKVHFKALGLAIIDEQHRFGVAQRLALRQKLSDAETFGEHSEGTPQEPHLLMMSATPIPRTLAMSYYADLDVSTIDELPPGRTPIVTKLVAEIRRDEIIERIRAQLTEGRQIYWVCPLIEESEALDLRNATDTHQDLCNALPGVMVGLLHSRMSQAEKKAVMSLFVQGQMGVLVSTTVIEVGVDVPNASLMVIEHAERFGLSQLHQLRGRVGRGAAASACVLLYSLGEHGRLSDTARARLRAMADTNDGFEIARRDLEIRGPGEFLGSRQSGAAMLRFADLAVDGDLLQWAQQLAPVMLDQYPPNAARHVERWLGGKSDFLKA
ncbi:MAG: ATP-dependent helicase RecG [Pseudomonadota bacterium]|jgi:ATP-dependent DNA helicase RecG